MPEMKARIAEGAISGCRFVKAGTADYSAVQAAAAADKILGVSDAMGAALGEHCDVVNLGPAEIELGGTVAAGDRLTADANGKGVVAGAGEQVGAVADVAGVAGDIIPCMVVLGTV